MDRSNAIREALAADEPVYGAAADTFSPTLIEIYGELGLDFVWLDLEHAGPSPDDSTRMEEFTRAAEVAGVELLVRLPSGDPPLVRKVLDAGVRTVLIPRVETAAEVRAAVAAGRFRYDGEPGDRGVATARTGRWGGDREDHAAREDAAVSVGAMIENRTAVENLEGILSVPELGFVFVGPADLSASLGRPLETDRPDVREHVARIEAAAAEAGVPLGGIRTDPEAIRAAVADGYRLLRIGTDLDAVRDVLGERLSDLPGRD